MISINYKYDAGTGPVVLIDNRRRACTVTSRSPIRGKGNLIVDIALVILLGVVGFYWRWQSLTVYQVINLFVSHLSFENNNDEFLTTTINDKKKLTYQFI